MDIFNYLLGILQYSKILPPWAWILILFAITGGYLLVKYWPKKSKLPPPPTGVTETAKSKDLDSQSSAKAALLRKACQGILKELRKRPVSKHLRPAVAGRGYIYQIPWFMLIGETQSGKTTLLKHTQLNLPWGPPKLPKVGATTAGCDAWFFNEGLVLDIAGDYVLRPDFLDASQAGDSWSDESGWATLLAELQQLRPQCPIDGIIVTVSSSELIDAKTQPERLARKAEYLYQKLWQAQKKWGIRFPIYLLITQCDRLNGFTSFCQALPEQLHHQMFGWSNPDHPNTVYEDTLAARAFQKIYHDLNDLQLELVTATNDLPEPDQLLLFPHQFRQLFQNLKIYLDRLFQSSIYHENFFLRGIYFCGDAQASTQPALYQSNLTSDHLGFDSRLVEQSRPRKLLFLHHFFSDKLFSEADLARPVTEYLDYQRRLFWGTIAAVSIFGVIWLGLQAWSVYRVETYQSQVQPVLKNLAENLYKVNSSKGEETYQLQIKSAETLLTDINEMPKDSSRFLFMPLSWSGSLENQITGALTVGYQRFVWDWMKEKFFDKETMLGQYDVDKGALEDFIKELSSLKENIVKYNSLGKEKEAFRTINSNNINEMNALIGYLSDNELSLPATVSEKILKNDTFEPLPKLTNDYVKSLSVIVLKLINTKLGNNKKVEEGPLSKHLNELYTMMLGLQEQVEQLENTPMTNHQWVAELMATLKLIESLSKLEKWPVGSCAARLEEVMSAVNNQLSSTVGSAFDFTNKYAQIVENPESFKSFKEQVQEVVDKYFKMSCSDLEKLEQGLMTSPFFELEPMTRGETAEGVTSSPVATKTGSVETITNSQVTPTKTAMPEKKVTQQLVLSAWVKDFQTAVNQLSGETFMKPPPTKVVISQRFPENIAVLQEYEPLSQAFKQYVEKTLPKMQEQEQSLVPAKQATHELPKFTPWLRKAAEIRLHENIMALVAKSQSDSTLPFSDPLSQGDMTIEQTITTEVNQFLTTINLLTQIFETLNTLETPDLKGYRETQQMGQLVLDRASQLLQRVDTLLEETLYLPPNVEVFNTWRGEPSLADSAFEVQDPTEMKYYLDNQYQRVNYLAQCLKPLLEGILLPKDPKPKWFTLGVPPPEDYKTLKWQRILDSLAGYQAEKPNNSLKKLEKYIAFDLNQMTVENCSSATMTGDSEGDYFSAKHKKLQELLWSRCQILQAERQQQAEQDAQEKQIVADLESYDCYSKIEDTFNQQLAERFPFAHLTENELASADSEAEWYKQTSQATPEDIQRFFADYAEYNRELIKRLEGSMIFTNSREAVIKFLKQLDQVQPLFADLLQRHLPLQDPLFDFMVEFRVNPEQEKGANQIIEWQVQTLNPQGQVNQVLQYPTDKVIETGHWWFGQPLAITLRWARNSNYRPYWDGQTSTQVMTLKSSEVAMALGEGRNDIAEFKYTSPWSLLELLQRQRILSPHSATTKTEQLLHTLQLAVPVKQFVPKQLTATEQLLPPTAKTPPIEETETVNNSQIRYYPLHKMPWISQRIVQPSNNNTTTVPAPGQPLDSASPPQVVPNQYEEEESTTQVFLRLSLATPDPTKPRRLPVPEFPAQSPSLNIEKQFTDYAFQYKDKVTCPPKPPPPVNPVLPTPPVVLPVVPAPKS